MLVLSRRFIVEFTACLTRELQLTVEVVSSANMRPDLWSWDDSPHSIGPTLHELHLHQEILRHLRVHSLGAK